MLYLLKKAVVNVYGELTGWERTRRQLGVELVETNLKLKEAEAKIVHLELALMEGPPEPNTVVKPLHPDTGVTH